MGKIWFQISSYSNICCIKSQESKNEIAKMLNSNLLGLEKKNSKQENI